MHPGSIEGHGTNGTLSLTLSLYPLSLPLSISPLSLSPSLSIPSLPLSLSPLSLSLYPLSPSLYIPSLSLSSIPSLPLSLSPLSHSLSLFVSLSLTVDIKLSISYYTVRFYILLYQGLMEIFQIEKKITVHQYLSLIKHLDRRYLSIK